MSPENHEIRALKKQREDATPEAVNQIDRAIAAIRIRIRNQNDFPALLKVYQSRDEELKKLETMRAT